MILLIHSLIKIMMVVPLTLYLVPSWNDVDLGYSYFSLKKLCRLTYVNWGTFCIFSLKLYF